MRHRMQTRPIHFRGLIPALLGAAALGIPLAQPAQADPYRWCAEYGGFFGGGGTNCYFTTWQQCQAAISGVGGYCRRNTFYTGSDGNGRPRKQRRPG
jgi:hypothetical protein